MAKIAFIGAGSVVFARRLLLDLFSFPELRDSKVALMDIDSERLEIITEWTQSLVSNKGFPAVIESTLDRRRALDGADYVIIMIQVGGLEAFELDIQIPLSFGIDQTVGDTLGPGGVFRGLRTIPVFLDICRDMEELCPNALLINYSNPMAINCWGMNEGSRIANVGLCHSVQGTAWQLSTYVGVPLEEISYWVAGINHMAWFLRFERGGEDLYPALRKAMNDPEIFQKDKVRFEIMRHFGYFVTESTHHMSEYVPWFRKRPELIEEFVTPRWDYLQICKGNWAPHYEAIRKEARGEEEVTIDCSHEYGIHIIHSMETNQPRRINGSVRNDGLITNLPDGCCVEVPILVDNSGLHPCFVGDLPAQCASLNRLNVNVQELAVQAALEGNREKARMAIALDPLTGALLDLRQIDSMVAQMFEAEKEWLPQF